jgi:hypothetical protein
MGMTTVVANVPVGQPQLFRPGSIPYCVEAIPGATGTVLIETSRDNGATYQPTPLGSVATVNTTAGNGDLGTIVRVSAATVSGTAVLMDLSQPTGGAGIERATINLNGVPYTTQATLTTEAQLFACRFPIGSLKTNFRLECDLGVSSTNNANVKTLRVYFGNSVYGAALEGGTIIGTQLLTTSASSMTHVVISSRNDNANVDGGSIGTAGGFGISTTAAINVATPYSGPTAVEQVLAITYQKATAADVLTLNSVKLALFQ